MPVFEYKGLNREGKLLRGSIDSESLRSARSQLKDQGLFLQELKIKDKDQEHSQISFFKRVPIKTISVFTRLLCSLLKSNVPLVEALSVISQQIKEPYFKSCVTHVRDQVNEGKPFHLALKTYPDIFDVTFVSLCESGEASGHLDAILNRLADLIENRSVIRSKITSALIYPGILLFVTVAIMIVLCTYVIPSVVELFENQSQLPWMTQITIGFSEFLIHSWMQLLGGVFVCGFLFLRWKKTKKGKHLWDKFTLSIPIFGRLMRSADIALFSRTFSTLINGGIPVLQAMDIVKNVVKNELIKSAIQTARENIKEGETITEPLRKSGQFPPVVLQMIRVGEKTGELEFMLDQIAKDYDRQVSLEVAAFTSVLGPFMLIFMACVIGFVLVSIMMPMLSAFEDLA